MNIAVFASHGGSDLQAIIDACKLGKINATVCAVISNNEGSKALERAINEGIDNYHLSNKVINNQDTLDQKTLEILDKHHVDVIFLAGYLKKLSEPIVQKYEGRIFNVHPALLPKFGGKGMYGINVHRAVLEAGEKITGITIHRADKDYDNGDIIAQTTVDVLETDTPESLAARVLEREHAFLAEVIGDIVSGRIMLGNGTLMAGE